MTPPKNNDQYDEVDDDMVIDEDDMSFAAEKVPPNTDVLHMDQEIGETLHQAEVHDVVTHLRSPVPFRSELSQVYEDQYGIVRRNPGEKSDEADAVTNNVVQGTLVNTWLPFIDLLLPSRYEIFTIIQQSLLKHLEQVVSGAASTKATSVGADSTLNALASAPHLSVSSSSTTTNLTPTKLLPGQSSTSSSAASTTTTTDPANQLSTSNAQLRQLFDYLLPYFHNLHMKPIWRIVLLEMKRRDMTLESNILVRLSIEDNIWTSIDASQQNSESSSTTTTTTKRKSTSIHPDTSDNSHLIKQQDLAIKTYLWRLYPKHFLTFLHTAHNLYDIRTLCSHVDHLILYNYLLSEWRRAFKKYPARRRDIALLRRQFASALLEHNSNSVYARNLRDTIEKRDPLAPLVKILENWISQHDLMIAEFRMGGFTRLKNILRQLSQFFESIQKREKVWKDVAIMFSERNLQRIIVHDLFAYISFLYSTNLERSSSHSRGATKRKKLDPKTTTNMLIVSLSQTETFTHLLHHPPVFTTQVAAGVKDHHDQALLILTQSFLLGEHALQILKKRAARALPVVYQTVITDAYPYILQLLHAEMGSGAPPVVAPTGDAVQEVISATISEAAPQPDTEDSSIHLRSTKKINILFTDPLLRKIMLLLANHCLSKRQGEKFHALMKYMFEEDMSLQEVTMDEEFHVFLKPMMEKCVRRWSKVEDSSKSKKNTPVDLSLPAESVIDEALRLYFAQPLLFSFLRRILCPQGEHTPSEYTSDLVGIEHTSRGDEQWFVQEFFALTDAAMSVVRRAQQQGATVPHQILELVRDIATNLNGLLSGGIERVFSVTHWKLEERGQELLQDLKEHVRQF